MTITLTGDTGINTPGLASTGMPTSGGDPIVESGSNSDGRWVRWADGTQQCNFDTLDLTRTQSNELAATWTFPAAFIASVRPVINPGLSVSSADYGANVFITSSAVNFQAGFGSLDAVVRIRDPSSSFVSGTTHNNTSVFVTGQWK